MYILIQEVPKKCPDVLEIALFAMDVKHVIKEIGSLNIFP